MKINSGFVIKQVGGREIVIAVGKAAEKFNGYITLNNSSKLLWNKLTQGATKDELVQLLLDTYDVEREIASADVDKFVEKLLSAGIIDGN